MPKPRLSWLLVFIPTAIVLEVMHASDVAIFITSGLAILPLAGLMGNATEELAVRTGSQLGGLLNATFGNAAELIIAFFLILDGQLTIVKASLTGSIIGNCLLVLGLAFLVGGIKSGKPEQTFSRATTEMHSGSMVIAVVALLMPALFALTPESSSFRTEAVSLGVSIILIGTYVASLVFSLVTHKSLFGGTDHSHQATWSMRRALGTLLVATAFVALMSEFLVGALDKTVEQLGLSELFVGLIIVPIIGNAAEHASAVLLAAKDKMDISIEIAIGSSVQIALFVAPVLVFVSLLVGEPMDLIFTGFEIAAVGFSTAILGFIVLNGRSNWFEGVQLLAVYAIMAISFYFI
jgi:Ca2+:H+ antiporter